MAARGAFLAPALVPVASSFVSLPRAFVQTFLGGPDAVRGAILGLKRLRTAAKPLVDVPIEQLAGGAVILELSWETVDGYVQRVCAAWVGALVKDPLRRCGAGIARWTRPTSAD